MRTSRNVLLKFIQGVRPAPSPTAMDLFSSTLEDFDDQASSNALKGDLLAQTATTLRIGGAQLLEATDQRIMNNNGAHPLYFSQTGPKAAGLCPPLCRSLYKLDIKELTPLQGALVPLMLRGKHVIAHAETGSGKSFGVALAVANRIARDSINYRLHTLIFVPTTQLALQYEKWLKHFAGAANQVVQIATEEIPLEGQLARLHNVQPHVLVGTPKRIATIHRMAQSTIGTKLRKKVDTLIVDEADLVLDMPVEIDGRSLSAADLVDRLYRNNPWEVPAQLVATSATIDGMTAQRLNRWMSNEKVIRLTTSAVEHTMPTSLQFYFYSVPPRQLPGALNEMLKLIFVQNTDARVLIFTQQDPKEVMDAVDSASLPDVAGAPVLLHDDAPLGKGYTWRQLQAQREHKDIIVADESNVSAMGRGDARIGVGHVAVSRGLHISGITHVIVYGSGELPEVREFVHCAGRTGRVGVHGSVITMFEPSCGRAMQQTCEALGIPFRTNRMSEVRSMLDMASGSEAEMVAGEDAVASAEAQ